MSNYDSVRHTVSGFILGDFVRDCVEACKEKNLKIVSHEIWRFGREYKANLYPADDPIFEVTANVPKALQEASVKPEDGIEAITEEEAVATFAPDKATDIPDWNFLESLVSEEDKDGLIEYAADWGVQLNRRKSPGNLYKDFKKAMGV